MKMENGADNLGATIDDDLTDSGIGKPEVSSVALLLITCILWLVVLIDFFCFCANILISL